ncbi:MAG: hypothetical protein JWM95_5315, partial [Gemmatimonadetes bacterium]|nr:hypothetical protein [Gemmatimonadota bacterium]
MSRRSIWVQVLTGWVPVWGLFAALLVGVHGTSWHSATLLGLRMVVSAGVLSLAVRKFTQRLPWPRHVRPSFVAAHAAMAIVYSLTWHALNSAIESIVRGRLVVVLGPGIMAYLSAGIWLYVMIAGICYATTATERAAQAEGNAAKSQLAALRSHLHPHFLFNAMHTVVQLIPLDPARAALAAEQLAGLLRRAIEEDRDLVPVSEEWSFVKRYLALERIRFGDRLRVHVDIDARVNESLIPLFALQTLVENAVRHGAAPNI